MKRSLLMSFCVVAIVAMSLGQAMATISLSLNLRYTDPANAAGGGTWDLLAKTDNVNGISALVVVLDNITFGSTTFNSAIDGIPIETSQSGTLTEIVWGYDVNATAGVGKFADVGNGAGTPGNVPNDDLFGSNATYNNMALIMSGAFGATRPSFGSLPGAGGGPSTGQSWSSGAMTAGGPEEAIVLMGGDGVRGDSVAVDGLLLGDSNRDGVVNNTDFGNVINNFFASPRTWDQGDFNSDGVVNNTDFGFVINNFFASAPNPAFTAVPEPASFALLAAAGAMLGFIRKR